MAKQVFAEGGGAGSVLVAPNPLGKEWAACVDVFTSYSLSDSHPEQPKRFPVAMQEGILPIALLPDSNILFPGDPADFYWFGSDVVKNLLVGSEETQKGHVQSIHVVEGAEIANEQSSIAVITAIGLDEKDDILESGSMSSARCDLGGDGAECATPPVQRALALAHEALFHELSVAESRNQEVKMIEDLDSAKDAEQHLVHFAKTTVTWENFLRLVLDKVPDGTLGFAKASWLATETVLSMAIQLTRGAPRTQPSGNHMKRSMQIRGNMNTSTPDNNATASLKYGIAVVRPAGHHSGATLRDFSLSAFCGLNHVMTAASYLAYEGQRVLVIDVDAHFARGSQQIALAVNQKLTLLGKPRILVSDISAALYQGEVGKEAAKKGHLVFTTNRNGSTEMETVAHANWFPPAHLKDGELNDAWLSYALLRTLAYCKDFTFYVDSDASATVSDEAAHPVESEGPDVILISLGLDAAKGEPDPEADCTCLGYALMAEILKKPGVPIVFALEGGGYRHARDLNTMGQNVFPGLLVDYEELSAPAAPKGSASAEPPSKIVDPARLFEGAVEIQHSQTAFSHLSKGEGEKQDEVKIRIEKRTSNQISVFGGNFQAFVRALGGHFEWDVYDPANELRGRVCELENDIAKLSSAEFALSGEGMLIKEEVSLQLEEARRHIQERGTQIQKAIENIYKATNLHVDMKPVKKNNEKNTKNERKHKARREYMK